MRHALDDWAGGAAPALAPEDLDGLDMLLEAMAAALAGVRADLDPAARYLEGLPEPSTLRAV